MLLIGSCQNYNFNWRGFSRNTGKDGSGQSERLCLLFLTWSDAIPEYAWKPECNANLDGAKDNVVGIATAQINPEEKKCYSQSFVFLINLIRKSH